MTADECGKTAYSCSCNAGACNDGYQSVSYFNLGVGQIIKTDSLRMHRSAVLQYGLGSVAILVAIVLAVLQVPGLDVAQWLPIPTISVLPTTIIIHELVGRGRLEAKSLKQSNCC